MQLDDIIKKVSAELEIPQEVCYKAYMSAWKFIYDKLQEQPLNADISMEEFLKLRPNINIRGIGKFHITPKEFENKKKRHEIIQRLIKEKHDKDNKDD